MSPKLPLVTGKALIQAFHRAGYITDHQTGSHVFLFHQRKPSVVVNIPNHGKDLKKATLHQILKHAEVTIEELTEWL